MGNPNLNNIKSYRPTKTKVFGAYGTVLLRRVFMGHSRWMLWTNHMNLMTQNEKKPFRWFILYALFYED